MQEGTPYRIATLAAATAGLTTEVQATATATVPFAAAAGAAAAEIRTAAQMGVLDETNPDFADRFFKIQRLADQLEQHARDAARLPVRTVTLLRELSEHIEALREAAASNPGEGEP